MRREEKRLLAAGKGWHSLRYGAALVLLFGLVAYKAGLEVAGWFIACGLLGYMNTFYVFRLILPWRKREKINKAAAVISVIGSILVVYFGYGLVLGLATAAFILIDAMVLRFK